MKYIPSLWNLPKYVSQELKEITEYRWHWRQWGNRQITYNNVDFMVRFIKQINVFMKMLNEPNDSKIEILLLSKPKIRFCRV